MTTQADHRVVAGILVRGKEVLLCHRREDRSWYPGTWDLPGGHIELGESAAQALTRECVEELDVAIRAPEFLACFQSPETDMTVFVVTSWVGEPRNVAPEEHQSIGWFNADQVGRLPLSDARLGPLLNDALRGLDRMPAEGSSGANRRDP